MTSSLARSWNEFSALARLDLTIGTRSRAFAAALAAHAAFLGAFVVLWSGGVPLMPGANLYEQQRLVDAVFLVTLLPWVCARCGANERGNGLVMLAAVAATTTSRVLAARFVSRSCAALVVALSGFPLMLVAEQISAVPLWRAVLDVGPSVAFALTASAMSLCWSMRSSSKILAWVAASASTALLVLLAGSRLPAGVVPVVLAAVALGTGLTCAARSRLSFRYLAEGHR